MTPTDQTSTATTDKADEANETNEHLLTEDLIEEISIDGMCGVY